MRQKWVLFERFALSLPYPLPMHISASTKGMVRFCRPLDLTKSCEILRFEENHGPDPPEEPMEEGRWERGKRLSVERSSRLDLAMADGRSHPTSEDDFRLSKNGCRNIHK